jgi:hypothetical protein
MQHPDNRRVSWFVHECLTCVDNSLHGQSLCDKNNNTVLTSGGISDHLWGGVKLHPLHNGRMLRFERELCSILLGMLHSH